LHTGAWAVAVSARAGLLGPFLPDQVIGMGLAVARYGRSLAGIFAAGAARTPRRLAVVDESGSLTYGELDDRTSTLAAGLADCGLDDGDRVGVLCRNHRGFVQASVALAKMGADTVYLNAGMAEPQLAEVFEREGGSALIIDPDLLPLAASVPRRVLRIAASGPDGLEHLTGRDPRRAPPRRRDGAQILLTSGTTGSPKGARRGTAGVEEALALLDRIPLRAGDVTYVAAPMFHAWGYAHLALAGLTGSTAVVRPRFDPEATLQLIADHQITVVAAVPVMLQRIMELPESIRARYDPSSLRVVAVSGSALPGELATRFMDTFGDVLYNLYGSTEVAYASIATPTDLRAAPDTAGRPPRGTIIKLLDGNDEEVPAGGRGRIYVGNRLLFSGYTGGGSKRVVGGLMATGDTGHFDRHGRLFVDGRDDDMIVSGGENVFPREVEDLLATHPAGADACVIGLSDDTWGQCLRAYVVVGQHSTVTAAQLKDHVRARLARFKVPRDVVFVAELPRNAAGKVVRRLLPP